MDPATDKKVEPMSYMELAEKYLVLETENTRLREALTEAIPFVEMAAYADNSGEEYGRLCQECESIFSQHTDNCALSAWLERNKEEK